MSRKGERIGFRPTDEERAMLQKQADEMQIRLSDLIRQRTLKETSPLATLEKKIDRLQKAVDEIQQKLK